MSSYAHFYTTMEPIDHLSVLDQLPIWSSFDHHDDEIIILVEKTKYKIIALSVKYEIWLHQTVILVEVEVFPKKFKKGTHARERYGL